MAMQPVGSTSPGGVLMPDSQGKIVGISVPAVPWHKDEYLARDVIAHPENWRESASPTWCNVQTGERVADQLVDAVRKAT